MQLTLISKITDFMIHISSILKHTKTMKNQIEELRKLSTEENETYFSHCTDFDF
jgi:predicted ATP-grasp superfamily ATP-dependent carboligase